MAPLRRLAEGAGSYVSETDYYDTGWQAAYWGEHYQRLSRIKRKYDPENIFRGHHTVEPAI